jgi:hypothetical protein
MTARVCSPFTRFVTRVSQTLQSAVALASLVALGGDVEEGKRRWYCCCAAWCSVAEGSACRRRVRARCAGQIDQGDVMPVSLAVALRPLSRVEHHVIQTRD